MLKKVLAIIVVCAVIGTMVPVFAADKKVVSNQKGAGTGNSINQEVDRNNGNDLKEIKGLNESKAKELKNQKDQKDTRDAVKLAALQVKALDFGIDTTCLTADEIKAKISEVKKVNDEENGDVNDVQKYQNGQKKLELLIKKAQILGIDPTGLTADQLKAKILEANIAKRGPALNKVIYDIAKKLCIDLKGMTIEQIRQAIIDKLAAINLTPTVEPTATPTPTPETTVEPTATPTPTPETTVEPTLEPQQTV